MKCKYCGGEVGLEEAFCPFCGQPNEQAFSHQRDMAEYRDRFSETKAAVTRKARHYSQIVPRVLILLFLVVGSITMFLVSENAYSFPDQSRRRAAVRNAEKTTAILEGYLEAQDYASFASYCDYNSLRLYTDFPEYQDIYYCAEYYMHFVIDLEKLFLQGDRESWWDDSADSDIRSFCSSLSSFYDTAERSLKYHYGDSDTGPAPVHITAMRNNADGLLAFYLGIGQEELSGFLSLSDTQRAAYVEEVLLNA